MIESIFTATPAEIDTEIVTLRGRLGQVEAGRERAARIIRSEYVTDAEFAKANADMIELSGKAHVLNGLIDGLTREYERRGYWTRYYVVDNNNGHLHTNTRCQNTYDTTEWVWMPSMSGMTKAEAVAEGGSLTCLSCFPEFREEIESGREPRFETPRMKRTREERETAATKKAAKAAKAAAEAITNPDGTPLLDSIGWEVKREAKARSLYVEAASAALLAAHPESNFQGPHSDERHREICAEYQADQQADADRYLAALAHKAGVTTEAMAAELDKKVQTKFRSIRRDAEAFKARNTH